MSRAIDLAGQVFGRLTVIDRSTIPSSSGCRWRCICKCGKESHVASGKLRGGHIVSCGCKRAENARINTRTHGFSNKSRTYRTWKEMRQRCMNQKSDKWKWYGGRGISICERWSKYENFLSDMGERPESMTLDRIDNDGPYSPDNCKWATHKEQTRKQKRHKLNMEIAAQIRCERAAGASTKWIASKYGISLATALAAATGKSWV